MCRERSNQGSNSRASLDVTWKFNFQFVFDEKQAREITNDFESPGTLDFMRSEPAITMIKLLSAIFNRQRRLSILSQSIHSGTRVCTIPVMPSRESERKPNLCFHVSRSLI